MNGFLSVEYIVDVLWKMISGEMEYMVLLPMDIGNILNHLKNIHLNIL